MLGLQDKPMFGKEELRLDRRSNLKSFFSNIFFIIIIIFCCFLVTSRLYFIGYSIKAEPIGRGSK